MSTIDLTNVPTTQKIAVVNPDGTALAQPTGVAGTPAGAVQSAQGVEGGTPMATSVVPVALSATFTRPSNTTAYASGDLVANSVTAGSVTNMSVTAARVAAGSGLIQSIHFRKSSTSVTTASFRIHVFTAAPTYQTNGDNDPMNANMATGMASHIGEFDITLTSAAADGAGGLALPTGNLPVPFKLASGQTLFFTVEAKSAYTPASAEVFTIIANIIQN